MNGLSNIIFLSLVSVFVYSSKHVTNEDQVEQANCAQLIGYSIVNGEISPPIPTDSMGLCCQWCVENTNCVASVFVNNLCSLHNITNLAAKIGYVALLPNGTIPSPLPSTPVPIPTSTSVPTSPTTGLLAAWNQASGIYADGTNQTARYNISNGVVIDTLSSIQWEQAESANTMSWSSVSDYCASQTTGGFSDWRAPNIGELQTLVDFTVGYPNVPINATAFPNTSYINFWSSTQVSGSSAYNWVVLLSRYGGTQSDSNTTLDLVRCVRSSYPVPFPTRYTLTSGVVTDTVTGLIWQQHAPTIPYSQPGANTYCNSLSLGDFTFGWRLPTIKELSSLVDFNVSPPGLMMDPAAFAGEPLSWYWSSTPQAGFSGMTWFVDFSGDAELSVVIGYTNNRYSVRCVHDPAT